MTEKKPKGKVYINIRQALIDFNKQRGKAATRSDIAEFVFSGKGLSPKAMRTKLSRKLVEDSKYELTLTEAYNVSIYLEIDFQDFIKKYTKAI